MDNTSCLHKIKNCQYIYPICFYSLLMLVYYFYFRGVANFSMLDDYANLNFLNSLDNTPDNWFFLLANNKSGMFGRSMSMVTFIFDWLVSFEHYAQFKRTNIAIHLLCGCFGFILIKKIIQHIPTIKEKASIIALLTTSLWLLAPIHVSTVLYSVQRMAQLSTLFVLLALILYIHFRGKSLSPNAIRNNIFAILFSNITLLLAILSKENGVVGFGLILLIEIFIFNFKTNNKRSTIIISYYSLCVISAIVITAFSINTISAYLTNGYASRDFTIYERLLTQIHVVCDYIKNIIAPNINTMTVFHDDFPITSNLFSSILTPIKLFILITPITLLAIKKIRQNTLIKCSIFGYLFYIIAISLESSIIHLEIYYEHRNYLPSWGIFLAASILMVSAITKIKSISIKRTIFVSIIIYIAIQAMFMFMLTGKWRNEDILLNYFYQGHQSSIRANTAIMHRLLKRGDLFATNNMYQYAKNTSIELERALSGAQIINHCQQNLIIKDKLYMAFEHPWTKQTSGNLSTSASIIGQLTIEGKCQNLDTNRFINILINKTHELQYNKGMLWRVHNGAAYVFIATKDYKRSIQQLESAWNLFPNLSAPGFLIVDIANILKDKKLINKTIMRLEKSTPENNIFDQNKISKLREKHYNDRV